MKAISKRANKSSIRKLTEDKAHTALRELHHLEIGDGFRLKYCFALAAVIFILLMLRRPGTLSNPQFWAEDSIIFFRDQALYGTWHAIFTPYAGYSCLLQRLIAAIAALFSARFAPLLYITLGGMVDALCCAIFCLPWFRHILRSDLLRAMCCLLVATAVWDDEIIGNTVNLGWFVLLAGSLLVFREQRSKSHKGWQAAAWLIAGVLAGLTIPILLIVVPFSLLRIWRQKGRESTYEIGLVFAVLTQLCIFWNSPEMSKLGNPGGLQTVKLLASSTVVSFFYRGVLAPVFGQDQAYALGGSGAGDLAVVMLITVILGIFVLWRASSRLDRKNILIALSLAFFSMAITLHGRRLEAVFADIQHYSARRAERYFFLTACVCIYLAALAVSRLLKHWSGRWQAAALLAVFTFGTFQNYELAPYTDMHWPEYAASVDKSIRDLKAGKPSAITVPVNPFPWTLKLP